MQLLLITKTEMDMLNIQFLLKNNIILAYTYEDFLKNLHTNIDTVGFTTKAVSLMSTPSKFVNLLKGIRVLYGYKLVYFSEDSDDSISRYINQQTHAYVAPNLLKCSEIDIKRQLDRDELKALAYEPELSIDANDLPKLIEDLEKGVTHLAIDQMTHPIVVDKKLLSDVLTLSNRIHNTNRGNSREISRLLSQKVHLLDLSTQMSDENNRLIGLLQELDSINRTNYTNLCSYKDRYEAYQETLEAILQHGIESLNENLDGSVRVDNPTYPLCVVYLKQITHMNYLSSYVNSLLKILLDRHLIGKFLRVLPKNSTQKLKKYSNHVNTSYGLDAKTYSEYSKFVHLGNPYQIIEFMTSNKVPIDVLIILDETAMDMQYCYGNCVIRYNVANNENDLEELGIDLTTGITNTGQVGLTLPYYNDYATIESNSTYLKVFHEKLELTETLINNAKAVIRSE